MPYKENLLLCRSSPAFDWLLLIYLVQEPPPQEKGPHSIRVSKSNEKPQIRHTNAESTRGADKHIKAPHIHSLCCRFHLKNAPGATGRQRNRHVAMISLSLALRTPRLTRRPAAARESLSRLSICERCRRGWRFKSGQLKTVLILCTSMRWRQCAVAFPAQYRPPAV